MDVLRQIEYWTQVSDEDIEVAKELFAKNRYRHALFFGHLALEKILKAHVTKKTSAVPPRTHNLLRLSEIAGLDLAETQAESLREFDEYQIEGRYPSSIRKVIDAETANKDLATMEEMREWLKKRL